MNYQFAIENATTAQTQNIDPIDVLSCASCEVILSDTNMKNFVDFIATEAFTVLRRTSNHVLEDGGSILSKDDFDKGCVYTALKCSCGVKIGRYYTAVTKDHIEWAQCSGLWSSKLKTYTIDLNGSDQSDGNAIAKLCKRQEMVEAVIIAMDKRLHIIESTL